MDAIVTVVLPVRGRAGSLATAAESILRQGFDELELLLLDDGSSEGTGEVVAWLEAADGRVRVMRQAGLGAVTALNRGVAEARGAFIARMDPDAVAHPERLERQLAAMARRPQMALLGTGWRLVTPEGQVSEMVLPAETDAGLRVAMQSGNALGHPTVMMRRDAVLRVGGYREAFAQAEDYDLWLRLMDRYEVGCLPEALLDVSPEVRKAASWRAVEQRILSEMGALAAADRRQAGRPDFGDGAEALDRARLVRMGLTAEEITAGVLARAWEMARAARSAEDWRGMRRVARLGMAQPGLSAQARARFWKVWGQSWLGRGGAAVADFGSEQGV